MISSRRHSILLACLAALALPGALPAVAQPLLSTALARADSSMGGGKWFARWKAFVEPRLGPGGTPPDARAHLAAAEALRSERGLLRRGAAEPGWVPVGPVGPPATNHTGSIEGIGRINCVAFHPTDSSTMWVGVGQGGVWKTVDGGMTWRPLTDELPILRISDIAVDPNDPETLYISVGDYAYIGVDLPHTDRKRHTHYGLGVYKTTDGGDSWAPTGLSLALEQGEASLIRRVLIDPRNSARLLAAGAGGTWTSSDAGATWTRGRTDLIWDIERDPSNPDLVHATTGYLSLWNLGSAGIIRSTDFGATWQPVATQIPAKGAQRIELAVSAGDPRQLYAVAGALDQTLHSVHRSTDAGVTWTQVLHTSTGPNILGSSNGGAGDRYGQGSYDLAVFIDPEDPRRVFVGGINIWGSEDGGATWARMQEQREASDVELHPDQHQFAWHAPTKRIVLVNDGGIYTTSRIELGRLDGNGIPKRTLWRNLSGGLAITSFYRVGVSRDNPGFLIAGAQDNGSYYFDRTEWSQIFGGDGMDCFIDHRNPRQIYGSAQFGSLLTSPNAGLDVEGARPTEPRNESGEWSTPFTIHPSGSIFAAYGNVWRSDDGMVSWERLSEFPDASSGVNYPTPATAMAISPVDMQHIYVAKKIWYLIDVPTQLLGTSDGGATWRDITGGLPDSLYVTALTTHASDPLTVWATLGGFVGGQKVYRTTDGGASWTNVSRNLPNVPVNTVVHDGASDDNTVYVGTDIGVFRTDDRIEGWEPFGTNLPNVIVSDLELHPVSRTLYAATFGRGLWSVDLATSSAGDESAAGGLALSVVDAERNGAVTLEITGPTERPADLEIIDVRGRVVHRDAMTVRVGPTRARVDAALPSGLYFARLRAGERSAVVRFVVR